MIEVRIDIKPGNNMNPINPKSAGTIPVIILSTIDFNASSMVDRNSLTFGRTGNEASLAFCNQKAIDINYDGLPDLLCHFKIGLAGFQKGDAAGILHGHTIHAVPITGQDAIKIIQ